MIIKSLRKRFFLTISVLSLACFIMGASMAWSQNLTHTVQKGDTLWSICEKYYGDADLWPKLWQMNPFVTNPHLLDPAFRGKGHPRYWSNRQLQKSSRHHFALRRCPHLSRSRWAQLVRRCGS